MFLRKLQSDNAPKAIGPYSPAVRLGDFVFLSGQIPLSPITNEIVSGDIQAQTRQVMENIKSLLEDNGLAMYHIVKTTIFVKDMNDFSAVNEVYSQYFQEPYPARSTVEVARLPKDVKVEIEVMAIDTTAYENMHSCHCDDCCDESCCCGE